MINVRRNEGSEMKSVFQFFPRLVADWVTVWEWNPRLYRRVSLSGFVLGILTLAMLEAVAACVWWMVTIHG